MTKRALILTSLITASLLSCTTLRERGIGSPMQRLLQALGAKGIDNSNALLEYASLHWKRPDSKERWQIEEKYADQRDQLLPIFADLGLVNEVLPTQKSYDFAVLHGALTQTMERRFSFLVQQFKNGVRFKQIVVLSGHRILDAQLEIPYLAKKAAAMSAPVPKTEVEMIDFAWKNAAVPDAMRKLPFKIVDAKAESGRARTPDTVNEWMRSGPKPGAILAITTQPFLRYQDLALKKALPQGFTLETCAPKAKDDISNAVYLDSLYRFLWESKAR